MKKKSIWTGLSLPSSAPAWTGWAALMVIAVPPILFGPWLPFLDLVAFVGLNNYPAKLSYGPLHYGVFEFTYIVHYALSRFLGDLGISVPAQIVGIYLLQAGVFFTVIWRTLSRLISHAWTSSTAIAFGVLAYWDGLFLWGGPLPFSLAATALAGATYLTMEETETANAGGALVALLSFCAVMAHPFALPFALLLCCARFWFVEGRRRQTAGLIVALLVFGWVIRNDSPEGAGVAQLAGLFSFSAASFADRFTGLFIDDAAMVKQLFGFTPARLSLYFTALSVIRLLGFLTSPVVAWLAKDSPRIRLLAILDVGVALMYFCASSENSLIPWWPHRILTFYSPFTYLAGIVSPGFLLRFLKFDLGDRLSRAPRAIWAGPVVILVIMVAIQVPILRLGENVRRNYYQIRDGIMQTGISNALLVVSDVDKIRPFYLRSVPFLLYSDRQMLGQNLLFYTEWHVQPRHPTQLVEGWLDLGRQRYQAIFSSADGTLAAHLELQAPQALPLPFGNNEGNGWDVAAAQRRIADELQAVGCLRDAIERYEAALRVKPDYLEAHNGLGVSLHQLGRLPEAIAHYEAAIRINPNYADAHFNLGVALAQSGHENDAQQHFEMAIKLKPDLAEKQKALQRGLPK